MKKIKLLFKSILAISLAVVMIFSVGCNKSTGPSLNIETLPGTSGASIKIANPVSQLIVGQQYKFNAVYGIVDGTEEQWVSSDENVAVIDNNGNVEAMGVGQATFTVTYGSLTAQVSVSVNFDPEQLPAIITPFEQDSSFNIVYGDTYTFMPMVSYIGNEYADGNFTYSVEDPTILSLDGNKATALKKGQTKVTIEGEWRGLDVPTLTTSVYINVIDDVVIKLENFSSDSIDVYTVAEFESKSFVNTFDFSPVVVVNDNAPVAIPESNIVIANNQLVKYENGKLIGQKFGQTSVDVKYNDGSTEIIKQYVVNVLRPQVDFSKTVNYFSSATGNLRDETKDYKEMTLVDYIYGEGSNKVLVDATINGEALTVKNNNVLGITGINNDTYNVTISVGTATEIYNVDLVVYGKYIYEAKDLDVFVRYEASMDLDCYIYLAKDIDAEEYKARNHFFDDPSSPFLPSDRKRVPEAKGFMGVFEGNGHVIKNLTVGNYGLFLGLKHASLMNVAFHDAIITGGALLGDNVDDTVLQNVYIKVAAMANVVSAKVIAKNFVRGLTATNVMVNTGEITNDGGKLLGSFCVQEMNTGTADIPTDRDSVFENCIVISKLPTGVFVPVDDYHDHPLSALSIPENYATDATYQATQAEYVWTHPAYYYHASYMMTSYNKSYPNDPLGDYNVLIKLGKLMIMKGVVSYNSFNDLKDVANNKTFTSFTTDCWVMQKGVIAWKGLESDIDIGKITMSVGSVSGMMVSGFDGRPIEADVGENVYLPAISCMGYKVTGWRNINTGEIVSTLDTQQNRFYIANYDGRALKIEAVWTRDSSVTIGPEIEL